MVERSIPMDESAVVILVPEAEALVARYRKQYDHAASLGVPAHITLLYPFIPPASITPNELQQLEGLFSNYIAFDFALSEVQQMPGVVFLAPSPKETIVGVIEKVAAMFPNYPPYGGQFPEIIPHLTIAQSEDANLLKRIKEEIDPEARQALPIHAAAKEVSLLEKREGWWNLTRTFPLRS